MMQIRNLFKGNSGIKENINLLKKNEILILSVLAIIFLIVFSLLFIPWTFEMGTRWGRFKTDIAFKTELYLKKWGLMKESKLGNVGTSPKVMLGDSIDYKQITLIIYNIPLCKHKRVLDVLKQELYNYKMLTDEKIEIYVKFKNKGQKEVVETRLFKYHKISFIKLIRRNIIRYSMLFPSVIIWITGG